MIRIGQGYDVHKFEEGRPLIIGGITIPHDRGLTGHSDADVLLHTMTDAALGAIGEGDIGRHFPDTDAAFKDADSAVLLEKIWSARRRKEDTNSGISIAQSSRKNRKWHRISRPSVHVLRNCCMRMFRK